MAAAASGQWQAGTLVKLLARVVEEWDVLDEAGRPLPATVEVLRTCRYAS